jgi:hypothetical protein
MEREIVVGLILETDFIKRIKPFWKDEYLNSRSAKLIAEWCWKYFEKHGEAPKEKIELIYTQKSRKLKKEEAEEIELILQGLSEEYESVELDIDHLIENSKEYFAERQLAILTEKIQSHLNKEEVDKAQRLIEQFIPIKETVVQGLDSDDIIEKLEEVFNTEYQEVISFPGALGEFWNDQMVRGGFVSFLAPEKRGKTFMLLEFLVQAFLQKRKVAFFQAGDMTENQQLMRLAIYLSKKSNKPKYCGEQYLPVKDCIHNQTNFCRKPEREKGNSTLFTEDELYEGVSFEKLKEKYEENRKHSPCYNCLKYNESKWGVPWLKKIVIENELTLKEAKKKTRRFLRLGTGKFKISTHVNGTLSVEEIDSILQVWKSEENFVPDLILVDYADILVSYRYKDERHNINHIWKGLRALSQKYDALVISPTQADAESYSKDRLGLKNFSEDKRKFAHVTATFGLNQDKEGIEKGIGILRINKIIIREGDFHESQEVSVLQRLEIGRPNLGSYQGIPKKSL